jgi:hypothetical protein
MFPLWKVSPIRELGVGARESQRVGAFLNSLAGMIYKALPLISRQWSVSSAKLH